MIIKCAETGLIPPASGVMVSAAAVPAGFRTVKMELITVVSTIALPTNWEAPVARPATVYAKAWPFKVNRAQLQLMLADAAKHAFAALIVWKTDRIGRSSRHDFEGN